MKCPICENKLSTSILNNYDEPPEQKTNCSNCGFTEYYFYFEGCSTYISKGTGIQFEVVGPGKNEFISRNEYKKMLEKRLIKDGKSVQDLIEEKRNHEEEQAEKIKQYKLIKKMEKQRWEEKLFTKEERNKIHELISNQLKTAESLPRIVVIDKVERDDDGLLVNFAFHLDIKESECYVEKKSKAQTEYCIQNKLPEFAPTNCYNCKNNIYSIEKSSYELFGVKFETIQDYNPIEKCSSSLITGCPKCNRSFVD